MAKLKPGTICPTCQRKVPHRIVFRRVKPRKGPMRDKEYRAWLRGEEFCVIAAASGMDIDCYGPLDPAHTERNGMSSKGPDSSCVPLCRKHHDEYDKDRSAKGRAAFDKKYGVDMAALAKQHYARYLSEKENA